MNTEKIAALLRQLADAFDGASAAALPDVPTAAQAAVAPPPAEQPKANYTVEDCKALINKIVVSDENKRAAIKAVIGQFAPTLAQCNQLQLNAIADELEKLV